LAFLSIFSFGVVVFFLTRQVPLKPFSSLMNLALFALFFLQGKAILDRISSKSLYFFLLYLGWASFLLVYAIVLGNEFANSIRFFIIITLIQLAFLVKTSKGYVDVLIIFLVIQAMVLFGIHLALNIFFNIQTYLFLRIFFQTQGWGDLYTYNGLFYNIQVLGNALLPFGFFISVHFYRGIKRLIISSILLIGIFIAGNFAFFLGLVVFAVLTFLTSRNIPTRWFSVGFGAMLLGSMILFAPILNYLGNTLEKKSEDSNPTRIDQTEVLWADLSSDPFSLVFGKGLGNTVDVKTKWRDYTDNLYFELQSIYFLNQLGLFNFLIFTLANALGVLIFFTHRYTKVIYVSYLMYSFFNPYFLDTSHIVAILVLIGFNEYLELKNRQLQPAVLAE
jgi:hypothetical protein